jgi:hypothetical protein
MLQREKGERKFQKQEGGERDKGMLQREKGERKFQKQEGGERDKGMCRVRREKGCYGNKLWLLKGRGKR